MVKAKNLLFHNDFISYFLCILQILLTKYNSCHQIERMRWAGYLACMRKRHAYTVLWENVNEGENLEDPGVDGRSILK
jgi:hypothetical protein